MPLSIGRRRALATISSFVAAPFLAPRVGRAAEAWPIRPVKYVHGFPAGGATDTLSRVLCQKMSELSGQSFVVENKAGAGGVLGADAIAKSPADGYTVGLGGIASNVLAIGSYAKLPYRPREDFTFISGMWQLPNILTAKKGLFSADLKELLEAFRKEPGKYTYASAGFGTTLHLSGEMMNSMAGVEVMHVPYKGAGPAMTAVIAGEVNALFAAIPAAAPHLKANRLRALAVGGARRSPLLPDTPTIHESGFQFDAASWYGMLAPKNTPRTIVAKLNETLVQTLTAPAMRARLTEIAFEVNASSPDAFAAHLRQEITTWSKVVAAVGRASR
jgi:tripartite-type tricarboxylate transporter receptor subunit TctC